jgi:hypothetical protein
MKGYKNFNITKRRGVENETGDFFGIVYSQRGGGVSTHM